LRPGGRLGPHAAFGTGVPKGQISIQMWSVRDMFAADLEGTLRAFPGSAIATSSWPASRRATRRRAYGRSSTRALSGHDGWDTNNFDEASYRAQLERAVTLGQQRTGFAWFPGPYTEAYFGVVARRLNRARVRAAVLVPQPRLRVHESSRRRPPRVHGAPRADGSVARDVPDGLALAGRNRNKLYIVERDSQVHPLTTARIGYEFLRSV
jgi:hypothetical protein